MSADRLLLGLMGCLALQWLAEWALEKRRCPVCRVVGGHEQDCPFDMDQR